MRTGLLFAIEERETQEGSTGAEEAGPVPRQDRPYAGSTRQEAQDRRHSPPEGTLDPEERMNRLVREASAGR
jgi:hypothetical protein